MSFGWQVSTPRERAFAVSPLLAIALSVLCMAGALNAPAVRAQSQFHFSDPEQQDREEAAARRQRVQALVSVPCQARLKSQKILLLVAEQGGGNWEAAQGSFVSFIGAIEARLKALGLRTFTQQQIKQQIAQAEIDAYFKNDPDAALAASRRLAARYVLRGDIVTQHNRNAALGIPEVAVTLTFTLSSSDGKPLSRVSSRSESYSGSDTLRMAQTLVEEQADELVGQLYSDYCSSAGH
jgi:hypothetical protein